MLNIQLLMALSSRKWTHSVGKNCANRICYMACRFVPICAAFLCFDKLFTNQWMDNSWMDTIRVLYKSEENKTADIKCNQHVDQCGAYAMSHSIISDFIGKIGQCLIYFYLWTRGSDAYFIQSWSWWYFTVNVFFISRNKIFKTTIVPNGYEDRLFFICG